MTYSFIKACDYCLPEKVVSNEELSESIDTTHEWIVSRTGIHQRHIAAPDQTASSLGYLAAQKLLLAHDIDPESIDIIIVATSTPDFKFPATAVQIQGLLSARKAFAFDVQGACAGFVYALVIADQFIKNRSDINRVLVIGTEVMSRILDWQDRTTCVLFGDGAGAVLLEKTEEDTGIIDFNLFSDGKKVELIQANPLIKMKGPELYRYAVEKLGTCIEQILAKNALQIGDIDWFIPHQANIRIIKSLAERYHIPFEKFIVTLDQHANTSAASIPIALAHAIQTQQLKHGDLLLLEAIGGGLVWGSVLMRWCVHQ